MKGCNRELRHGTAEAHADFHAFEDGVHAKAVLTLEALEERTQVARDLKLIPDESHAKLTEQVAEIKRMLTVFVQKLKAESWCDQALMAWWDRR